MDRPDIKRLPKRANPLDAQKKLLDAVRSKKQGSEKVGLELALGRILAHDAISNVNIPSYDKTFIDGYAINTEDTADASPQKPAVFKIVGKLFPADYPAPVKVRRCEAVYVACGAPIPDGATASIKVEETRLKGDKIEVVRHLTAGEGIIPTGDDVQKDAVLLKAGRVLRPQDVGLLASIGLVEVEAVKKLKIGILSGGDELIKQSSPKKFANNYALVVAGLASELGAQPKILGIMPDNPEKVQAQIRSALADSDIVVTIGGSSVGVKDFVPDAVNALGKPGVVVQGVLLRPGAVSGFGLVDGTPVVMLPGHIGSCIAGFYLFLAPLIHQLGGGSPPKLSANLAVDLENGPQYRFLLLKLTRKDSGLAAVPVEGGSSALSTIAKSNGYAIVPPHTRLEKDTVIDVYLFGRLELADF
jgi:molybdopterin molybdotransferase